MTDQATINDRTLDAAELVHRVEVARVIDRARRRRKPSEHPDWSKLNESEQDDARYEYERSFSRPMSVDPDLLARKRRIRQDLQRFARRGDLDRQPAESLIVFDDQELADLIDLHNEARQAKARARAKRQEAEALRKEKRRIRQERQAAEQAEIEKEARARLAKK